MKIFLTQKGFTNLIRLAREAGTTPSELVEELVREYDAVPADTREKAEYKCEYCSHAYFVPDNLAGHIKTVHGKQIVIKNDVIK